MLFRSLSTSGRSIREEARAETERCRNRPLGSLSLRRCCNLSPLTLLATSRLSVRSPAPRSSPLFPPAQHEAQAERRGKSSQTRGGGRAKQELLLLLPQPGSTPSTASPHPSEEEIDGLLGSAREADCSCCECVCDADVCVCVTLMCVCAVAAELERRAS